MQTDDTASAGNKAFMAKEGALSTRFQCKAAATLNNGETIRFNGANIGLQNGTYMEALSSVPRDQKGTIFGDRRPPKSLTT